MRKILFAVLMVALLCSCGPESSNPDGNSAQRQESTGDVTVRSEETTVAEERTVEEATERTAPATTAEPEPELRDGPATTNTDTRPAVGTNGMVSSAHPLATEAGLEVLEEGGNAFDAAVAVAAALNVVEPMMSGVGGYGAIVVYDAEAGETRFLEVDSRTPAAVDPAVFRPPTPGYQKNRCGARTVATPGNLNAWEALSEEHGDLEWKRLFEPAIRYADGGFAIGEEAAGWIGSEYPAFPAHAQEIYGKDGEPLGVGDRLVQEDLADSLRTIADEGAGAVYEGEIGEAMVSEVQEGDGFLTMDDLQDNHARWRETVGADYRGNTVVTAAPPATSWGTLVRLGVMGQFGLDNSDHNSVSYLHALTEASKLITTDAGAYIDPETGETRLEPLLSEKFWAAEAEKIDFSQASGYTPPMKTDSTLSCSPTNYTPVDTSTQQHTTHFVVADREGNVVSATQTLGNVFGSKVMPEGTGIWLNDEVAWARFEPAGNPFEPRPGRQIPYALGPTLVMQDGRPRTAIGTPGGRTILQITPQMIMNVTDFDMDIQQALAAPRFGLIIPKLLTVEKGIPVPVRNELSALGHDVYALDELGNAHALTVEYGKDGKPTRFTGASDPRGEGSAEGL